MEQPEETAAEPEAQGRGRLGLVGQGGVVELQLVQGLPQGGILAAVNRVQTAVDHRTRVAVTAQR